eukprot:8024604-Pyramimonas_sp.AAC.1
MASQVPRVVDELDRLLRAPPAGDEGAARLAGTRPSAHSASTRAPTHQITGCQRTRGASSLFCVSSPWLPPQSVIMIDRALVCYRKLPEYVDDATLECAVMFFLCQHVRELYMQIIGAETMGLEDLPPDDSQRQERDNCPSSKLLAAFPSSHVASRSDWRK